METTPVAPVAPPSRDRAIHPERGIVAYLAIAFGLAWLAFLTASLGLGSAGAFLMPVAPAIACFVVRRWVTREGFGNAGRGPTSGAGRSTCSP